MHDDKTLQGVRGNLKWKWAFLHRLVRERAVMRESLFIHSRQRQLLKVEAQPRIVLAAISQQSNA